MNRSRTLTLTALFVLTLTAAGQQVTNQPTDAPKNAPRQDVAQIEVPPVEAQLKVLTEKLDLTVDQQAKIAPVIRELHDETAQIVQEKGLTYEEQLAKVRPYRIAADKQLRAFLSDDQKAKLDQYLRGPHSEIHGNLTGAKPQKH
jgi:Spy/CpxP family protein refolding chaperone